MTPESVNAVVEVTQRV